MTIRRPTLQARRVIGLVALIVLLAALSLTWDAKIQNDTESRAEQTIATNNQLWCDSLDLLTSGPAPRGKAQAEARRLYSDFITLRHRFGCDR